MANTIVLPRADLLDRLKAHRPVAKKIDADNTRSHRQAEKEALTKYRAKLREHLKLTYAEIQNRNDVYLRSPGCPRLVAPILEQQIQRFEIDTRKRVTVNQKCEPALYGFLTYEADAPTAVTVCD